MLTQSRSASVSDDFPLAQTNSESSGTEALSPRRFSQDLLSLFNVTLGPTPHEIRQLQTELDHECLQLARSSDGSIHHESLDVSAVIDLTILLSSPFCPAKYPGTFLYQEVQLRALVSGLALLHYHRVKSLHLEQFDRLKNALSNFSKVIAVQLKSDSTLTERIRHVASMYLVQLASQYLSFISRGDSKLPSIIGPVLRILLGVAAGVSKSCFPKPMALTFL